MTRDLSIASVCRTLPTPDDPSAGVFVLNRLTAMAKLADVRTVQPVPYFPVLRPLPRWAAVDSRRVGDLDVEHAPMFYLPGILKRLDARWLASAAGPRIGRLHECKRLVLIDAHFGYPEGAGSVDIGRRLGVPVFITIRGFETECLRIPGIREQVLAGLNSAAGCVSVSHSLRRLVVANGVDPERVHVVHNAIDTDVFHFGVQAEARARLGIRRDTALIVSIGHLVSRKRHHVLIDAVGRLRQRIAGVTLVVLGAKSFESAYPQRLLAQVRAWGMTDVVRFLGNVPPAQVVDWLRAADLFALGTAREGCCNAVLEALATGVPVITTPVGDNAEFVRPGENGLLVPVDDVQSMSDALYAGLTRSDWNRPRLAETLGREIGSWNEVASRVLEFFRATLERDEARTRAGEPGRDRQSHAG